jgi:hypothetical protein
MEIAQLTRVRKLFNCPDVPDAVNRHNRREWVKSVRALGGKWLFAVPVTVTKHVAIHPTPVDWHSQTV